MYFSPQGVLETKGIGQASLRLLLAGASVQMIAACSAFAVAQVAILALVEEGFLAAHLALVRSTPATAKTLLMECAESKLGRAELIFFRLVVSDEDRGHLGPKKPFFFEKRT